MVSILRLMSFFLQVLNWQNASPAQCLHQAKAPFSLLSGCSPIEVFAGCFVVLRIEPGAICTGGCSVTAPRRRLLHHKFLVL